MITTVSLVNISNFLINLGFITRNHIIHHPRVQDNCVSPDIPDSLKRFEILKSTLFSLQPCFSLSHRVFFLLFDNNLFVLNLRSLVFMWTLEIQKELCNHQLSYNKPDFLEHQYQAKILSFFLQMEISHILKFFSFLNFIYFHYARLSTSQIFYISHKCIQKRKCLMCVRLGNNSKQAESVLVPDGAQVQKRTPRIQDHSKMPCNLKVINCGSMKTDSLEFPLLVL